MISMVMMVISKTFFIYSTIDDDNEVYKYNYDEIDNGDNDESKGNNYYDYDHDDMIATYPKYASRYYSQRVIMHR